MYTGKICLRFFYFQNEVSCSGVGTYTFVCVAPHVEQKGVGVTYPPHKFWLRYLSVSLKQYLAVRTGSCVRHVSYVGW